MDPCNISVYSPSAEDSRNWFQTERQASDLLGRYHSISLLLSIPALLCFGFCSDMALERRTLLRVPIFGQILCILLLGLDYHIELESYALLYASAAVYGLSGGYALLMAGFITIISDYTEIKERLHSFTILVIISYLPYSFGYLIAGTWLMHGFVGCLWFMFAISIFAACAATFREEPDLEGPSSLSSPHQQPGPHDSEADECECCPAFRNCPGTSRLLRRLLTSKLAFLILVYSLAYFTYALVFRANGEFSAFLLQTIPLCLKSNEMGIVMFTLAFPMCFGVCLVICLNNYVDTFILCFIGYVSRALGIIALIFANTQLQARLGKLLTLNILIIIIKKKIKK